MGDDFTQEYHETADRLRLMVSSRERHVASTGDACGVAPMCMGPVAMMELASLLATRPESAVSLIMVAVGEMSRLRQELAVAQDDVRTLLANRP